MAPISTDDYLRLASVHADHEAHYGDRPDAFGQLYLPAGPGPHPVAIVLHGGCWQSAYGLLPLGALCRALAHEGIAAWNLEYRRVGAGGGWPATFADVAAGTDVLRSLAPLHALDLSRAIAIGHSAGGHLALWLAARHRLAAGSPLASPDPLHLRGVVALAAIADLADAYHRPICGDAVGALLGGSPDAVAPRYASASPAALLPLGVPHRHVIGGADTIVPPQHVRDFANAARHAGDDARIDVVPGAGHFEPVVPGTSAWPAVRDAARAIAGLHERGHEWQAHRKGS